MRHPGRLWRDLGAWGFLGVHVTLAASILSALVHPWFYVAIAVGAATGESVLPVSDPLWLASLFLLVSGYFTGVALPALTVARRHGGALSLAALWHPIYWLAISIAAYRAMLDLFLRPYYWEKTPHRGAAVTGRSYQPSARSI